MGGGGRGQSNVGFGPMGQTQPSTQPGVSVFYMCLFLYSNSRGLFSSNQCTVTEEKAEMKGHSRLG
jgi:hypothetical protein